MKRKTQSANHRGFTLLDFVITMGVIALIAAIAVPQARLLREATHRAKLETDVRQINTAVDVYLANGGSLAGLTSPQAVLDKMKTVRSEDDRITFVGLSGSSIDPRLSARMQTNSEALTSAWRANWNPAEARFDIQKGGVKGVKEFYLDDSLAETDYGTESRDASLLAWNEKPGWIWDFKDEPSEFNSPTPVPTATNEDSADPPAGGSPNDLAAPAFLPAGGQFPEGAFPIAVSVYNPNPSSTWVMVSVDGGPWAQYTGAILAGPDSTIDAYATGNPANWNPSPTVGAIYALMPDDPAPLLPPGIQLSDDEFNEETSSIVVTMTNPNPAGSSEIHYAIKQPDGTYPPVSSWTQYSGPITATAGDYPHGFQVKAYARPIDPEEYSASPMVEAATTASFFDIPIDRDVLFVVDASGSMNNGFNGMTRFEATVIELVNAIHSIPSGIKFNAATFNGGIHWTDGTWTLHDATAENRQAIIDEVEDLSAGGSTSYSTALGFAPMFDPMPEMIILLSDGRPKDSYTTELNVLLNLGIPVHCVGFDMDEDAIENLEEIADLTGGTLVEVEEE